MSALETGKQLVALCRKGEYLEAVEKLYARNVVSIEAMGTPEMPAKTEGIAAIRGKNQWWLDNHEVHSASVEGPFVGPRKDQFAALFSIDITNKPSGQRMQMSEVALYTVNRAGKIKQEEFLYLMG
ncbi:MAG TPA: nuclear transport factor 2 family protein [Thermoanaerobaculia bacterium]|nr:nuclear transport factor 2 family protein [Thermoanaerobaculia bacterium]